MADLVSLLTADVLGAITNLFRPQWGLFQGGQPVVTSDNVASFAYKQEWTVSDYPVEGGAFASYDKVQVPFDVRLRYTAGGSITNRQALLDSIASIAGTTDVFDAVTPEETYQSVNVTHYDYNREAVNGVGLLKVDVFCVQIRTTATAVFSQTQSPSGADPVSGGTVQPTVPTPQQSLLSTGFQ